MSEEQPRVIYIRASRADNAHTDLAGLLGRITREAIANNNQRFILQLANDQHVLNTLQAWKTLKQITTSQGMSLVISGGSEEVRELANAAGFPIVGTAEPVYAGTSSDVESARGRGTIYTLPHEHGNLNFEEWSAQFREYQTEASRRTVGAFIDFVRLSKANKDNSPE